VQGNWFGDLLRIPDTPVPAFIPMINFAILFGLSMDYEVFLLSRIREEYVRTGDNRTAVADGLAATARVITAAAAIMVFVFGVFIFDPNVFIKQIGLGLSMPRSCEWCSFRRRWSCSATPTGGCRAGSTEFFPRFTSKGTRRSKRSWLDWWRLTNTSEWNWRRSGPER
jgi:hypothetical protein